MEAVRARWVAASAAPPTSPLPHRELCDTCSMPEEEPQPPATTEPRSIGIALFGISLALVSFVAFQTNLLAHIGIVCGIAGIGLLAECFSSRIAATRSRLEKALTTRRILVPLIGALLIAGVLGTVSSFWTPVGAAPNASAPTSSAVAQATTAQIWDAGWGPERETFTTAQPATYAVLNSITDNPAHGDERNFVQIRHSDHSNATYDDQMIVRPGDSVVVYAYVDNGAADNFESEPATLQGLRASVRLGMNSANEHWVCVTLSAKNATAVWDGALLTSRVPVKISVRRNSGFFHTSAPSDGFAVSDPVGEGALLGFDRPDGNLPVGLTSLGKEKGSGYLTLRLDVTAAT